MVKSIGCEARGRGARGYVTWPMVAVIYVGLLILYAVVLHPWLMNWGATAVEQAMALPGDEPPNAPGGYFTRAVTIDAPPEQVWAWLVQIGQDRAGFYSNDWLENLFGGDIHNADQIHPEWQSRYLGDKVRMAPRAYLGGILGDATVTIIRVVQPDRVIANTPGRFILLPVGDHATRLLVREPINASMPGSQIVGLDAGGRLVWDPLHFAMVKRMLLGIKERVEGQPLVSPPILVAARVGWVLAGIGLLAMFLTRRRGYLWLPIPIAAVTPQLFFTRDADAALAGFLAVGITIAGALVFGRRWWPPYALLAAFVLLILALAPDPYTAFGLLFDLSAVLALMIAFKLRSERTSRAAIEPSDEIDIPRRVGSSG